MWQKMASHHFLGVMRDMSMFGGFSDVFPEQDEDSDHYSDQKGSWE